MTTEAMVAEKPKKKTRAMPAGQPTKVLTKAELREAAMRDFDFGWIEAIEQSGRRDW